MGLYLPVLVVVLSNTVYHICAKSTPANINTFASLSISYAIAAVFSLVLYFLTQKNPSLPSEYRQLNWTSFALGMSVVGLEAGFIWMYKVGWSVSTGQVVQSVILAVVLIFAGYLLYGETMTVKKVIGIFVCLAGLYLIN